MAEEKAPKKEMKVIQGTKNVFGIKDKKAKK